ncbi:MAG TPA: hypothetical protein PK239_17795 [Chitinophagales bacterium]|nr:hypothetical protein [Chitinophagales bacterium]
MFYLLIKSAKLGVLFSLLVVAFPVLTGSIQTGIQFQDSKSLENIALEAANKKSYVFIHTTSGNCGGCNYLAQTVYPNKQVGDFYNAYFMNYTLNVDRLEHGNLAKILNLGSQAAVLYFEPGGQLVKKAVNITTAEELMSSAQEAIHLNERNQQNQQKLSYLDERVKNQTATNKEMREYAYLLRTFNYPSRSAVNQYLRTLSEGQFAEKDNMAFVYDMLDNVESMAADVLLNNLTFYKRHYGIALNDKIQIAVYNSLNTAIKQRDDQLFERILSLLDKASLPDAAEKKYFVQAQYYEETKDFKNFERLATQYLAKAGKSNSQLLMTTAEKFFYYLNTNSAYNTALKWVNEAINIDGDENYQTLLLKARLLRKLQSDCTEALHVAKMAREKAITAQIATHEIDNLIYSMANQGGCKQP